MREELDQTAPVRAGEELPLAELEAYLRAQLPDLAGPLVVQQFPRGHSNLTYLLRFGETEMVLRRGPFGNVVKTAHDMTREYRVLSRLWPIYPPAPRPILLCEDLGVMQAPFYIMERRRGVILRGRKPEEISIDPAAARSLSTALIDSLAGLHSLDYQAVGLADLGKPDGYVARQVSGWTERYGKAQTGDMPALDRVARWLAEHLPRESGAALVHNDFKYDNLVLDPRDLTRVVAVLDWEMATLGDPLMDLGTALGYWVQADDPPGLQLQATGPTALPGSLSRRELAARYSEQTGRDVTGILYYYAFGLYKIAVIVQQIYARFVRGHTRDARFAQLDALVAVLADQADRAIERGGI